MSKNGAPTPIEEVSPEIRAQVIQQIAEIGLDPDEPMYPLFFLCASLQPTLQGMLTNLQRTSQSTSDKMSNTLTQLERQGAANHEQLEAMRGIVSRIEAAVVRMEAVEERIRGGQVTLVEQSAVRNAKTVPEHSTFHLRSVLLGVAVSAIVLLGVASTFTVHLLVRPSQAEYLDQ